MKKMIGLILLIAMCFTLAACSSGSSSNRSSAGYSTSKSSKCHFKQDGREICSSPCARGSNFCSYHTKYLDDIYYSLVGGGN